MYEQYWGLKEKAFQNTPDPKFLYLSPEHEEGLSRLNYAVKERTGAGMLTGVFGCGKTLLLYTLIDQLISDGSYAVALLTNPLLSFVELLHAIATKLGNTTLPEKKTEIMADQLLWSIEKMLNDNTDDGKH
ncbi:MAG: AAA family ATPase, partial [Candidatus Omnitrophota bacterium]